VTYLRNFDETRLVCLAFVVPWEICSTLCFVENAEVLAR
jgi:hypothetical protein